MDWTNATYWSHNPGAYYAFLSVYPPLAFVFLRTFSVSSCYRFDNLFARECDWMFPWVFGFFVILNVVLLFLAFRQNDRRTALARTIAMAIGMPMLFGIERGQLMIPCFSFFVLANARLLRSARLRWLASAIAINFKPYLALTLVTHFIRRRWTALEGTLIAVIVVYLVSYGLEGAGTPVELIQNLLGFSEVPNIAKFENAFYQSSYKGILDAFESPYPFIFYLGSDPVEWVSRFLPLWIKSGQVAVVLVVLASLFRPYAVPAHRLAALTILFTATASLIGGYSEILIFFLVYLETSRSRWVATAVVLAYVLNIVADYQLLDVTREFAESYITQRIIGYEVGVTIGELVRPGLLLIMEFALVVASLIDIVKWRPADSAAVEGHRPPVSPTAMLALTNGVGVAVDEKRGSAQAA